MGLALNPAMKMELKHGTLGSSCLKGVKVFPDDLSEEVTEFLIDNNVEWKNLVFTDDLEEISSSAFEFHLDLESVNMAACKKLKHLPDGLFAEQTLLKNVKLPPHLEEIPDKLFLCCESLGFVGIPMHVKRIGFGAFCGCTKLLKRLTIPNSVTEIGDECFAKCSRITEVILPNGLEAIGDKAFAACSGIQSIDIPESVKSIGAQAFYGCEQLDGRNGVTIPVSVVRIGDGCFAHCGKLHKLTFAKRNEAVQEIGQGIVDECEDLEELVLPQCLEQRRLKSLGSSLSSLEEVVFPYGVERVDVDGLEDAKKVLLPPTLKKIDSADELRNVHILCYSSKVENIEELFHYCKYIYLKKEDVDKYVQDVLSKTDYDEDYVRGLINVIPKNLLGVYDGLKVVVDDEHSKLMNDLFPFGAPEEDESGPDEEMVNRLREAIKSVNEEDNDAEEAEDGAEAEDDCNDEDFDASEGDDFDASEEDGEDCSEEDSDASEEYDEDNGYDDDEDGDDEDGDEDEEEEDDDNEDDEDNVDDEEGDDEEDVDDDVDDDDDDDDEDDDADDDKKDDEPDFIDEGLKWFKGFAKKQIEKAVAKAKGK